VRDDVQAKRRGAALVAGGDEEVNRHFTYRTLIAESLKTAQSRGRKTGENCLRTGPEQRGAKELPIGRRSRLRDHDSAAWLLPAAGRYSPAKLALCHKPESKGRAEDAFVLGKHVVEALWPCKFMHLAS